MSLIPRKKTKDQPTPDKDGESMAQVQPIIEAAEQAATGIIAEAEAKAAEYVEESRLRTEDLASRQAEDMWALTDALIARAEAVKRQSDELLEALNQTKRGARAAIEAAPSPRQVTAPQPPPPKAPQPPPPEAPPPPPPVQQLKPTESVPRGRATPPPVAKPAPPPPAPAAPPSAQAPAPAAPEPPPPPKPPAPVGEASEGARLLATQMAVAGSSREEIANRLRNDFSIEDAESMLDSILGSG